MITRRNFLAAAAAAFAATRVHAQTTRTAKAQIAITLDLEMARNFPTWESTHWDYEKGNLNEETKKYAVEAARRVKAYGGVVHFFLVGRALEQENVDWLKELIREGHRIGNHTYDHVYLLAKEPKEIQYRFARSPWLIEGKTVPEVIAENIQLAANAMKDRLGIAPAGFRAPGGFADGLSDRPDVRKILIDQGYKWVSTRYPAHEYGEIGKPPTPQVMASILKAQRDAQPTKYPNGLIEIPMSPISDVGAFRNARWKLEGFVDSVRKCVAQAIEDRSVFDFLSHPSVLYVMDPEFRVIETICEMVRDADDRAEIVDLDQIADSLGAI